MRTTREANTGTLFALVLLGIVTSCGPAGATAWDMPGALNDRRAFVPIGWDTRMDRNFDRNYDNRGWDRRFHDRSNPNYNTGGWDRRFHDRSNPSYDNSGFDRPPNHFLNTPRRQ